MNDDINHPAHYTQGDIECIDAIEANETPEQFKGYLKGCVEKYLWRCDDKEDTLKDLEKARWYLNRLIKFVSKDYTLTKANGFVKTEVYEDDHR